MTIVSNTSPIMNLAVVNQLWLLEKLYGKIFIPNAVLRELLAIGTKHNEVMIVQTSSWIETRAVTNKPLLDLLLLDLDAGEAEAITLSLEMGSVLLLLDERQGRKIASRLGLKFIGLLGLLVEAKHKGLVAEIKPILGQMMTKAGFWLGKELYTRVLREAGENE